MGGGGKLPEGETENEKEIKVGGMMGEKHAITFLYCFPTRNVFRRRRRTFNVVSGKLFRLSS